LAGTFPLGQEGVFALKYVIDNIGIFGFSVESFWQTKPMRNLVNGGRDCGGFRVTIGKQA
jgi:hypothetical protein